MIGLLTDTYLSELGNAYWFGWLKSQTVTNVMKVYSSLVGASDCFDGFAERDPMAVHGMLKVAE